MANVATFVPVAPLTAPDQSGGLKAFQEDFKSFSCKLEASPFRTKGTHYNVKVGKFFINFDEDTCNKLIEVGAITKGTDGYTPVSSVAFKVSRSEGNVVITK